ncbi:MAG TPA: PP2C family protein-serine/threonine phosphatase [Candidatus Sulfotelmatobacter sp.]|jgi:sigma-B regulation protein RsbU (phosphoserine phosphatase)|nr:PP2C family protein-serine/threonine phosphatase [Candidatus Sulfotelmatobacter sp.]
MTTDRSIVGQLSRELTDREVLDFAAIVRLMSEALDGVRINFFIKDSDGYFAHVASSSGTEAIIDEPLEADESVVLAGLFDRSESSPIEVANSGCRLKHHPVLEKDIIIKLSCAGRLLGFIVAGSELVADDEQLNIAILLCSQLALSLAAMNRRQLLNRDFLIAQHVQKSLLPRAKPSVHNLEYDVVFSAASHVTGDFYDYVSLSPTRLAFIVGDIMGKGVGAGLLMANIMPGIRAIISEKQSPEETMRRAYQHVYDAAPHGTYATMVYGVFDMERSQLLYVNAGHQPVAFLIRHGQETTVKLLDKGGSILGLLAKAKPFKIGKENLRSGDIIVCATDGTSDAEDHNRNIFGEERFREIAATNSNQSLSAREIAGQLYESVETYMALAPQADDITIAVFKVR